MTNWEESILAIRDKFTTFRFDFTKYLNRSTKFNGYRFFWEMIPMIRFTIANKAIAYTNASKEIYLNIPSNDIPTQNEPWEFIYYHECLHQLFDTFAVEDRIKEEGMKFNHKLLNVASDCVINEHLHSFCNLEYPSDKIITPEYLENKFGIKYDNKADDQYTLYVKLLEKEDELMDDPLVQQERDGALEIDDENEGSSANVKTKKFKTSEDWKRGSKEARKAANDILEKYQKSANKKNGEKLSNEEAIKVLQSAFPEIQSLFKNKVAESLDVLSSDAFIKIYEAEEEIPEKFRTYDEGWDYAINDVLNQIKNLFDQLNGPKINLPPNPYGNEEQTQEVPENDPTEERPFLPKLNSKSSSSSNGGDGEPDDKDTNEQDNEDESNDSESNSSDNEDNQQNQKDTSKMTADEAAESAKKDAQRAEKAANQAEKNAEDMQNSDASSSEIEQSKQDAKDAREAAEKAKEAAENAEEAAENGDEQTAQQEAQNARDAADEAENKSKNSKSNNGSKNDKNSKNSDSDKPSDLVDGYSREIGKDEVEWNSDDRDTEETITEWGHQKAEIVAYAEKIGEMSPDEAKKVIKRFAQSADSVVKEFGKKCESAETKNQKGIIVQTKMEKTQYSWAHQFSDVIKNTVKQKVSKRTKEYEETYRRPNRRQGIVHEGDIIKKGRMPIKDRMTISLTFYIDVSYSMDQSSIRNIFNFVYELSDVIGKKYHKNPVVEGCLFDVYAFNEEIQKQKRPNIPRKDGGTMELDRLLRNINIVSPNSMINVIITDAAMDFKISDIKSELNKLAGMVVFITNNDGVAKVLAPLDDVKIKNNVAKFKFIKAPGDFNISASDFSKMKQ